MTDFSAIEYAVAGGVATLRLNRPSQRNALDLQMRAEIGQAVALARDDASVRVLVLTGSGGSFCAGGDLKALSEARRPVLANRERIRALHRWFSELLNLEKPVVAVVDGPAFGAGMNLALAADFVLATPRARFCAVFARIGLVPDLGGFFLLPRLVGLQRAKELVMTARIVGAEEALKLGLVLELHGEDRIESAVTDWCRRLMRAPTGVLGMGKVILNQSFNLDQQALIELEAQAQALALETADHHERVGDFLAQRPLSYDWEAMDKVEGKA
ncbi:MAG: enoyl-CoA hydratase/isomerase family protein [Pararhodobacter sp.]|nr:enoyl-CoA hydratase/isomerase family protein [Pararhodobacter sp.]